MVYTDGMNLVADTLDELHDFAANKLGLSREKLHDYDRYPHYKVWGNILVKAVHEGAKCISPKELWEIAKKLV